MCVEARLATLADLSVLTVDGAPAALNSSTVTKSVEHTEFQTRTAVNRYMPSTICSGSTASLSSVTTSSASGSSQCPHLPRTTRAKRTLRLQRSPFAPPTILYLTMYMICTRHHYDGKAQRFSLRTNAQWARHILSTDLDTVLPKSKRLSRRS